LFKVSAKTLQQKSKLAFELVGMNVLDLEVHGGKGGSC